MNIRAYRLLRNNKEEGPFTAEELIQKNLKPYDLIWVDGRSAAWSYPGEMAEFKMQVPLPGEQNMNVQGNKQAASIISASVQAAIAVNDNIEQPAIKQKPRYKVSAAWSKIQTVTTPVYKEVMVAETQKMPSAKTAKPVQQPALQSKSLSWEEAWLDWEKEKTDPPITEPVKVKSAPTPQAKTINENYKAPILETKYAEPLDSIKDKYIENILQQRKASKKGFSFGKASQFVIPSVALLVIFSVGYWLLHGSSETAAALSSLPAKTEQPKIENTNSLPANTTDNAETNTVSDNVVTNANTSAENNTNETQNIVSANTPVLTDQAEERKTSYMHAKKPVASKKVNTSKPQTKFPVTQIVLPGSKATAQKTVDKPVKQFDPSVINNIPPDNAYNDISSSNTRDLNAANNRPVRRRTNTNNDVNNQNEAPQPNEKTITKSTNTKSSANYVNVPEYIEMSNGSANLKIENVSDVNLDLVVVDVQYYDASNRFRKGETLYLHNLKAGKNITVKTPKDTNSMYATSKVSLVSSDANNVYVIGDK